MLYQAFVLLPLLAWQLHCIKRLHWLEQHVTAVVLMVAVQ